MGFGVHYSSAAKTFSAAPPRVRNSSICCWGFSIRFPASRSNLSVTLCILCIRLSPSDCTLLATLPSRSSSTGPFSSKLVTPTGTTGYYTYPCSTRHYLDVKLAMFHASNIKINLPKRFLGEFCVWKSISLYFLDLYYRSCNGRADVSQKKIQIFYRFSHF